MGRKVHHVSGRLRVKVIGLRDNPLLGRVVQRAIHAWDGVDHVDVRNAAESVIVHYDPSKIDSQTLLTALRGINGVRSEHRRPNPVTDTSLPPELAVPVTKAAVHMGKVFGKTAFKVAVQQVVEAGVGSAMRSLATRG